VRRWIWRAECDAGWHRSIPEAYTSQLFALDLS